MKLGPSRVCSLGLVREFAPGGWTVRLRMALTQATACFYPDAPHN